MTEIVLNNSEMIVADYIGKGREHAYKNNKRRMCGKNGEYLNIIGARAEIAVCKHTNTYPDLSLVADDYDCIIKGKRVDVKATDIEHGSITATLNKVDSTAEIYLLAYVKEDVVRLLGYCSREELITPESIGDLGYGPIYLVKQDSPKFHAM